MRLGILIPEFPTQTHVFFWREIVALRKFGIPVEIFSTRRPREHCPHSFAEAARAQTFYLFPPRVGSLLGFARGAVRSRCADYLKTLKGGLRQKARAAICSFAALELARRAEERRIDHLHVQSCADAAHVAAMAHLITGLEYSLHLHGDLDVYGGDHAAKMSRAAFIAAAARPIQQQLTEIVGVPDDRTCTVWMGVETDRFSPDLRERRPNASLDLVTVARLNPAKGHKEALAAVRVLVDAGRDVRYSIVGSGPDRENILAEVRRLKLSDRVTLTGSLGEDAVLEQLRRAHVFVLPSTGLGEASPVAVMEAMACGIPVVSTIIGGTPAMIADGVDGFLVPQRDPKALADAIARLFDEQLRRRLGGAARRKAVALFDCRVTSHKLISAIENARGRKGRTAELSTA